MSMTSRDAEFEAFVRQHRQRLRQAAFLRCNDWTQAEDIVQDALANLYVAWWRISAEQGPFWYASKTVANAAIDSGRRAWRRRELAVGEGLTNLAGRSPEVDPTVRLTLHAALRALPPRQQQVIILRFFLQFSVAETADQLDMHPGTVKSHCSRALARLNDLLTADPVGSDEGR
jgi:RNA polymerase sigma-70 factor (sigma-E family)